MNAADIKNGLFQMTTPTEVFKYMNALTVAEFQQKIKLTESEKSEIYTFIQDMDQAFRGDMH